MCNETSIREKINDIFQEIVNEKELDLDTFTIVDSSSKNVTIKTISIVEKPYPMSDLNKSDTKVTGFMRFDIKDDTIELFIRVSDYSKLNLSFDDKIVATDNLYHHIEFSINSSTYLDLIKKICISTFENYQSSDTFGCCAKYKECSAAKHCLHENKLHATGCAYKKNLDAGKIFY